MRTALAVLLLLLPASLFSQAYQDAVLVRLKTVSVGADCSTDGSTRGTVDEGNLKADSDSTTACADAEVHLYTVRVGESLYTLRPVSLIPRSGLLALLRKVSLANQLPGAHVLIRSHGDGFQVKVGSKESSYSIYEAR